MMHFFSVQSNALWKLKYPQNKNKLQLLQFTSEIDYFSKVFYFLYDEI